MPPPPDPFQSATAPAAIVDARFAEPPQAVPAWLLEQLRPMIGQLPASAFGAATGASPFAAFDGAMPPSRSDASATTANRASKTQQRGDSRRHPRVAHFEDLPEQRRLLDAIAAGESPAYDVIYGGDRFESYADHPRRPTPIGRGPNEGKTSSAAGRYQFIAGTWDGIAKELGLTDFSPESQDRAAWHLAAKTYAQKTRRNLLEDLREGRTDDVGWALKGQWTSLPGGIEPNAATNRFTQRLRPADRQPPAPSAFTRILR
jgi:muramidase (phage lysozyme)